VPAWPPTVAGGPPAAVRQQGGAASACTRPVPRDIQPLTGRPQQLADLAHAPRSWCAAIHRRRLTLSKCSPTVTLRHLPTRWGLLAAIMCRRAHFHTCSPARQDQEPPWVPLACPLLQQGPALMMNWQRANGARRAHSVSSGLRRARAAPGAANHLAHAHRRDPGDERTGPAPCRSASAAKSAVELQISSIPAH